jgi:5-formyltetrahydrofolate cyclo-ligase
MGMNLQNISDKKKSLRKTVIQERELTSKYKRNKFATKLANISHDYLNDGAIIAGYYPIKSELDIIPLMKQLFIIGHKVLLPCITDSKILEFRDWDMNKAILSQNIYAIPEPIEGQLLVPDFVYVPALLYDKNKYRLGYGGGFYDATIDYYRKNFSTKFIGVCYPANIKNNIFHEKHDQKVDFVIDLGKKYIIG